MDLDEKKKFRLIWGLKFVQFIADSNKNLSVVHLNVV